MPFKLVPFEVWVESKVDVEKQREFAAELVEKYKVSVNRPSCTI
jgi:hypothetical protein